MSVSMQQQSWEVTPASPHLPSLKRESAFYGSTKTNSDLSDCSPARVAAKRAVAPQAAALAARAAEQLGSAASDRHLEAAEGPYQQPLRALPSQPSPGLRSWRSTALRASTAPAVCS